MSIVQIKTGWVKAYIFQLVELVRNRNFRLSPGVLVLIQCNVFPAVNAIIV